MVKIGLIGCGRWGENHAKKLKELPCIFTGISDTDENKRAFAKNLDIPFFPEYRELLSSVDAVSVAVPTLLHYQIVKEALGAGKHVLVEKPVTLTSNATKELVQLAKEKRLILSVGYLYRFHPAVQTLKEMLKTAGKIHYIAGRYIGGQNRLWADSGAILNFGIHMIDILNFVLGVRPQKVYSKKQNLLDPEREDSATVTLAYDQFFATMELSCVHPEKERDIWIIAEKQKIHANLATQNMRIYNFSIDAQGRREGISAPVEVSIEKSDPLTSELAYFIQCVENHTPERFSEIENIGREEPDTTQICECARRSALTGEEITISYNV